MPILLLPFNFLLLFLCTRKYSTLGIRESFLMAALIMMTIMVTSAEVLSLFNGISFRAIFSVWVSTAIAGTAVFLRKKKSPKKAEPSAHRRTFLHEAGRGVLPVLFLFFIIQTLTALLAPPNTWDSMTYHMSRVMHWIQNGSLAFYPTNCLRQLYLGPGAEIAILHTFLLAGSDRFANCIQLISLAGSMLAVSLVARELGGNRSAQGTAAVFTATLPMAILQSTGTQNDLVLSFFLISLVFLLIRLRHTPSWSTTIAAGVSLGFCLLVKGTSHLFAPLLLAWITLSVFLHNSKTEPDHQRKLKTYVSIMLCVGIAIALYTPHILRTARIFENPINPTESAGDDFRVANEKHSLPIIAANIVRNVGLHCGTPSKRINSALESAIYRLLGPETDNPASTWIGSRFHVRPSLGEDVAGNPLHFWVSVITFLLLLMPSLHPQTGFTKGYALTIAVSFLLFCILLKWQPFHSRLHLPLFILSAPVVAVVLVDRFGCKTLYTLSAIFFLSALPWLLMNESRPLLGSKSIFFMARSSQYFSNRPDLEAPYRRMDSIIRSVSPKSIGIAFREDDWEYPLWALAEKKGGAPQIRSVKVNNQSAGCLPIGAPDLIVSTTGEDTLLTGGKKFMRIHSSGGLAVLKPIISSSPQP